MRLLAVCALLLACLHGPAFARTWNAAQISELMAEAHAMHNQGMAPPRDALARLAHADDLARADPAQAGRRDSAADALFAHVALAYARGAVDPDAIRADWRIDRPPAPDLIRLHAVLDGGASVRALLQALAPQTAEYAALRRELQRLRQQSAGSDAQIAQVRANMERWRWLPRRLPAARMEVRIAEYALTFYRDDAPVSVHAVIVGAPRTPTPVFAAAVESVTLNPDWTPPLSIVAGELLPRFRRNPAAAEREGFDVIDDSGRTVAASEFDWRARPFPYRLRQRPGPNNALGQLRFDLPNPFAVFLHDTPNRGLFLRDARALSHGCVRVQHPVQLGAAVLGMDAEALQQIVDTGEQQSLALVPPLPVYALYFTTALRENGGIAYLDDVYRRDAAIVAALDESSAHVESVAEGAELCGS